MPLWLSELLTDPDLQARLVAGRRGLDRRGPIRWAHISELPDPTPWLEGGELLLTTGLGVRDDPELQERFVRGVAERGVVGIGVSVGVSVDEVPTTMLQACDEHELPLFTMPYEIPFIAVSQQVAQHVMEERFHTLNRTVDLHRQVLTTVIAGGGVAGVLAIVSRSMPGVALIAQDFSGTELHRIDPSATTADLPPDALAPERDPDRPRSSRRASSEVGGRLIKRAPILLGEHLEAYVVAVSTQPLLEHEELLFEQAVAGVSLELARHRSVRDARRLELDRLLTEVVQGRCTSARVTEVLEHLDTPMPNPYRVLAISLPARPTIELSHLCALVEDVLLPHGAPVVGQHDTVVYAVVPDDRGLARQVLETSQRRGWRGVRIGRSRSRHTLEALHAAQREARTALLAGGPDLLCDIENLGVTGLLSGLSDDDASAGFVQEMLGAVLAYDRCESAALVPTLRAYLDHGCRPGPAAAALGIHRHTLSYRLERIHELTGRDPRSGAHLIAYGLALELLSRPKP